MKELRFHREVYDEVAVDEALAVFDEFMEARTETTDTELVVQCTAKPEHAQAEATLAAELANYALGLTIRRGGVS